MPAPLEFDPDVHATLQVDECWLVEPRRLALMAAPGLDGGFQDVYAAAVDALADHGIGCYPDPRARDPLPTSLGSSCVVYRIPPGEIVRESDPGLEMHLHLVCAMAFTDGAFVGSELSVALEVADRIGRPAGEGRRLRCRAFVREQFVSPARTWHEALEELQAMPREQALDVVETLKRTAWADGTLRLAEERMLVRVHELLGLPVELVGALARDRARTTWVHAA